MCTETQIIEVMCLRFLNNLPLFIQISLYLYSFLKIGIYKIIFDPVNFVLILLVISNSVWEASLFCQLMLAVPTGVVSSKVRPKPLT